MRKLNTSASILEVMGAPLSGSEIRAYVMSGGGPTLKNFKPAIRSKRCFLIFPIRGAERKGLVSVEAKKKKGQVSFYTNLSSLYSFHMLLDHITLKLEFIDSSCSALTCFICENNKN